MKLLPILTLTLVMCSCNHLLVPTWYDTASHGTPHDKVENEWVTIYLENLESDKELLVFDVEVVNKSRHPLYFNPANIYFYASTDEFADLDQLEPGWEERTSHRKFKPVAPEEVGNYYEKKIQSKKIGKGLIFLATAGLAAYTATQGGGGWIDASSASNQVLKDIAIGGAFVGLDVAGNELDRSKYEDEEDLYYLSDEIMNESWIPAESSVRGKVFFRQDRPYYFYRFMVPIEEEVFVYDFKTATNMESSVINSIRRRNR